MKQTPLMYYISDDNHVTMTNINVIYNEQNLQGMHGAPLLF